MATLKDIAQAAGVSVRTVSRALYDSGYVQELKKKRILDLAREMHYRVDRKARGLRTGISYEITGVINNVGELTAAKIAASEKILRERGYMLNLLFISNLEEREDVTDILEEVSSRNPAGILLFNRPDRLIAKLEGNNLAMVAVDMDSADYGCDSVSIDRQQGVYEAVNYLIRQGHARIAYIGHQADNRLAGYHRALQEHGLEPLLFDEPGFKNQYLAGKEAASALLEMSEIPDAVQAYTDETALGFLAGLQAAGRRVPDDIAVIGFDGRRASELSAPLLTTVAQPNTEVGRAAAEILLARIENNILDPGPQRRVLAARLIIRETA